MIAQHHDGAVERGGERQRLVLVGAQTQQPLDLGEEPLVGHAVGFVDARDLDGVERAVLCAHQVGQAQRRGDDDVDGPFELDDLRLAVGPAVDGGNLHTHRTGQGSEHARHLCRELTGRHEHEATRVARS